MNSHTHAPYTSQPAPQPQEAHSLPSSSFWEDFSPEERCRLKLQMLSLVIDDAAHFLHDHHLQEPYALELSELLGYTLMDYQEALHDAKQKGSVA